MFSQFESYVPLSSCPTIHRICVSSTAVKTCTMAYLRSQKEKVILLCKAFKLARDLLLFHTNVYKDWRASFHKFLPSPSLTCLNGVYSLSSKTLLTFYVLNESICASSNPKIVAFGCNESVHIVKGNLDIQVKTALKTWPQPVYSHSSRKFGHSR